MVLGTELGGWCLAPSWAVVPKRSAIGGLVKSPNRLRCLAHGVTDLLVPNAACC